MYKPTTAHKRMMADCRTSMLDSVFFYAIADIVSGASLIILSDSLGGFGESVLNLRLAGEEFNIVCIILSVLVAVILAPAIHYLADCRMLKQSLEHDRRVLMAFFQKKYNYAMTFNEGEIQERMEDDILFLRIYWVNTRSKVIACIAIFAMTMWEFIILDVSIGLLLFVAIALVFKLVLPRIIKKQVVLFDNAKKDYHIHRRSLLNDFGYNLSFFRQYGLLGRLIERLDKLYRDYHNEAEKKYFRFKTLDEEGQDFFEYASTLVLLVAGATYIALGQANAGQIVTIMGLVAVITLMFNYITEAIQQFPLLHNVAERAVVFYEDPSFDSHGKTDIKHFESIDIKNLSYSLSSEVVCEKNKCTENVLNNLSLHIDAGDKLVIKGENGCGKTTLIRLICGLISDYQGEILVNGKSIDKWKLDSWLKIVAVSTQHSHVFNCSITENILFDRYYDSIKLSEFSNNGLCLAEMNSREIDKNEISQLSGGEKQALSIARAIEKEVQVHIFDEPFNHLDKEKRIALMEYLMELESTVIVVTHDYDSISEMGFRVIEL